MSDARDDLHAQFCAWCKRVKLPRRLNGAADKIGDILLLPDAPAVRTKRAAVKAIAEIEAWKASRA